MGGVARLGPGGVLAGRRRSTRRKWHAHRQRTPTRVAKRWRSVIGAKGAVRQIYVTPLECRNSRHSAPGGHRGLTAVLTWPPCFQVRPILNGTLRTCMHACPPMSARRSNRAPFRPGMVSPHTTDLPAEKTPVWAILGRHVNVREIFQNISRTNTPTERQESGPRALVSQSVQGHDHLSVNGVVDYSSDWKPSKHICVSSSRPPLPNHDVFGDLCRFSSSITFTCVRRLDRASLRD